MSAEQPKKPVFFLDRTNGKTIRNWLKAVGMKLEYHQHYFSPEDPDPVWIARCAKEDWIILSGDKRIETTPENRQAAIDGKCKIFLFDDSNSKTEEWAAALLVGRERITEIIERNNGPFFVTITKFARSHISRPRPGPGGGPKSISPQSERTQPQELPKSPPPKKQQGHFWEE